ncbi:MAG TPA: hypothetical protein VN081_02560 [Dongiaceae bacterium]|nr:hypothetical protein [Dongiaceae bacterium]
MPLEPLSNDEWVNDVTTHLGKSGATLRSKANERLTALGAAIPRSHRGVPVEYDITYNDTGNVVRGYKMTDLMTTCLWTAICMEVHCVNSLMWCIEQGPTEEGMEVMRKTAEASTDKYRQLTLPLKDPPKKIIIIPGSNLMLKRALDIPRMKRLVEEGCVIKPHPITNGLDMANLKRIFGEKNVLRPTQALYPLIREAEKLWVGGNSESGIVSMMYQKPYSVIGTVNGLYVPTYVAFYKAMASVPSSLSDHEKLGALFSHPESGLLSIFHENPEERMKKFFAQYDKFEHRR